MSARPSSDSLRTWVEIDAGAARKNYDAFRGLVGKKVKLWSVVKSNAYGHGLFTFSKLVDDFGIDGFCVDSLVEGVALRRRGIKKQILVLGPTLPSRYAEAVKHKIAVTISSFDALRALTREHRPPEFHIKIDTGMHRQGFYPEDLPRVIALLKRSTPSVKNSLKGIYTHFAAAKDVADTAYTERQFGKFKKAAEFFEKGGFKNLIKHVSATGGTLLGPKYHLDAVRVGIGLYGLWPSEELEKQLSRRIKLTPVLSWRTVVSEVKRLKKGDYVGYDMTERVPRDMTMAVLPVGYWHGFSRALSGRGEVLVRGKRARVLGRVSMDLLAVGLTGDTGGARPGDIATIIGSDGAETISAREQARRAGTSHYEFVTRLNPLMERVVTGAQPRKKTNRKK